MVAELQWLGVDQPYSDVYALLKQHAEAVAEGVCTERVFSCVHAPVYTTGRRGIDNRLGSKLPAEVAYSDRGGEMTFHGSGQLMFYPVVHLRQRRLGVKRYVWLLEAACIGLLNCYGIDGERRCGFPGVWVEGKKIAALGVRVCRGVAYHGMALNVQVEAHWFAAIRPCGLQTDVCNMKDWVDVVEGFELADVWHQNFLTLLALEPE